MADAEPSPSAGGRRPAAARVYLVGFMGSGKSATGEALAELLGYRFIDLDREVEARAGRSVRDVFARDGEASFRELEHAALAAAAGETGVVVATGGGVLTSGRNRELIRESGVSVWLAPDFATLCARLDPAERARRPLFQDEEKARELYRRRLADYRRADLTVEVAAAETAFEVAARIAELLP